MKSSEAIWLLNEMKRGCESGDKYDDPLRKQKAEALVMGIKAIARESWRNDHKNKKGQRNG